MRHYGKSKEGLGTYWSIHMENGNIQGNPQESYGHTGKSIRDMGSYWEIHVGYGNILDTGTYMSNPYAIWGHIGQSL